jgi:glycosyltransferase involved in cell wall biosynthesis
MIRIGYDSTPLLGRRSGVGYYSERLLAAMIQSQPEWEYLLLSNRPLGRLAPIFQQATPVKKFLPFSSWVWMQFALPQIIDEVRPDLCHFTNALAPVRFSRPFVLTIHDASLFLHRQHHPWSRVLAIRMLLPFVARRATAVITVSQFARKDLVRVLRVPASKVRVIYEAAPATFQPLLDPRQRAQLREKYDLPLEYILYVGTLEPRKNLLRLLRSVHRLHRQGRRVKLVLVGSMGWKMKAFHQEIERLQMQDGVQYLGYVPTADLPGLYSMATVFAFPSLYEGFGLPPVEAMACGAPVLTSRASAMSEVCGPAAWLVNPLDEKEIAAGLGQILADPSLRDRLRQQGLRRAQLFSWQRAAAETTTVYRQALQANYP